LTHAVSSLITLGVLRVDTERNLNDRLKTGGERMSGMTHRERVIKAIRREEPDRVPFDLGSTGNSGIHIKAYQNLKAHFGIEAEDTIFHKFQQTVYVHEPILEALDIDFRPVGYGAPASRPVPSTTICPRRRWPDK
jgi:uroporphyrinogen decarboxylase